MKPLYISATGQDSSKTAVICGLIQYLRAHGHDPGYCKPVGQRYVLYENHSIDEDVVLARNIPVFGLKSAKMRNPAIVICRFKGI